MQIAEAWARFADVLSNEYGILPSDCLYIDDTPKGRSWNKCWYQNSASFNGEDINRVDDERVIKFSILMN